MPIYREGNDTMFPSLHEHFYRHQVFLNYLCKTQPQAFSHFILRLNPQAGYL